METKKLLNNSEAVTAFIKKLSPSVNELAEAIRKIILSTDQAIGEHIKWNSPSFFYTGEMKPFDPKEYKRDIVVINIHRGYPLLVFPTGARIQDDSGLLEGNYKDGRRMIKFTNLNEISSRKEKLQKIILSWLKTVEK